MATDLETVKSSQKQLLLAALTKTRTENKMTRINKTRVRERERKGFNVRFLLENKKGFALSRKIVVLFVIFCQLNFRHFNEKQIQKTSFFFICHYYAS